jgi:hypothetical protein
MTRQIGTVNLAEVDSPSLESVVLVSFDFGDPIYVHTGIGQIEYDGNTYLGVGDLGSIEGIEESEQLSPAPIRLTLSSLVTEHITQAFNAGNFGDEINIFVGYKNSSGVLVDDPWLLARGTFEHAAIELDEGDGNRVTVVMQHDLARIQEKSGRRFSDEDQQQEFVGDDGFSFVHSLPGQTLLWGGERVRGGGGAGGGGGGESTSSDRSLD